jgi:hypothetical protein
LILDAFKKGDYEDAKRNSTNNYQNNHNYGNNQMNQNYKNSQNNHNYKKKQNYHYYQNNQNNHNNQNSHNYQTINYNQVSDSNSADGEDEGWRSIPDKAIYKSWGSKIDFMHSYGLKPDPEGFEEARLILDAFKKGDYEDAKRNSTNNYQNNHNYGNNQINQNYKNSQNNHNYKNSQNNHNNQNSHNYQTINYNQVSDSNSADGEDEGWRSISDKAIYESWGTLHDFMHSYGLKPTPDGYEEARQILDAFKKADYEEAKRNSSNNYRNNHIYQNNRNNK